jgi:hypothetical protein
MINQDLQRQLDKRQAILSCAVHRALITGEKVDRYVVEYDPKGLCIVTYNSGKRVVTKNGKLING